MHDFNQNNNCIQKYLCCCPGSQGEPGASGILSPVYANLISTTAQTVTSSSQYGTVPLSLRLTGFSSANDFSLSSDGKTLTLNQAGVYIFSYGVILSSGASAAKKYLYDIDFKPFRRSGLIFSCQQSGKCIQNCFCRFKFGKQSSIDFKRPKYSHFLRSGII